MSDFIENQVQLLLAGQALENDDICNVHILASDTIGMSNYLYTNYCYNIIKRFFVHNRKMI